MDRNALSRRIAEVIGSHASSATAIDVLRNGNQIFPSMLEAIRNSTETVEFETFVYWTGDVATEFAEALAERSQAGVQVRVLIDSYGGLKMNSDLWERMKSAGCDCQWFRPLNLRHPWASAHRTHRKLLICDGSVGFTGGVGIAEEWSGDARNEDEWRDTHFRFEGSVVSDLRASFWENWIEATGVSPAELPLAVEGVQEDKAALVHTISATSGASTNDIYAHYRLLIGAAEQRIRITTAYFVPNDQMVQDLIDAVGRGVTVELLLPGPHTDKNFVRVAARSLFEELNEAGVSIRTYTPTMLHAKVMTVDGGAASIGSANFNHRSTNHDDETNVVIFDPDVVATLNAHFDDDWQRSHPLEMDSLTDERPWDRIREIVLQPFTYFM